MMTDKKGDIEAYDDYNATHKYQNVLYISKSSRIIPTTSSNIKNARRSARNENGS